MRRLGLLLLLAAPVAAPARAADPVTPEAAAEGARRDFHEAFDLGAAVDEGVQAAPRPLAPGLRFSLPWKRRGGAPPLPPFAPPRDGYGSRRHIALVLGGATLGMAAGMVLLGAGYVFMAAFAAAGAALSVLQTIRRRAPWSALPAAVMRGAVLGLLAPTSAGARLGSAISGWIDRLGGKR